MKRFILSMLTVSFIAIYVSAQTINYASVTKGDVERMNFEILGKSADNYLVYKELKGNHRISVYDYNMNLREEVPITVLPDRDRLLDISFFNSANHHYLLYQYQEGNVVYLKALPIEANGRLISEPLLLDTTMISYKTDNKIYNFATSNNGAMLMTFRINKRDRTLFRIGTKLYNGEMELKGESSFSIPMENKGDYLSGYSLTNNGQFAFVKYHREQNGNITNASFIKKSATADEYQEHSLNLNKLFLDDIKVLVDENAGRFLLGSFYSTEKRGDIEGLYVVALDDNTGNITFEKITEFTEALKKKTIDQNR